jgi:YggT family protein
MDLLYNIAMALLNIISFAIIVRALLSWFYPVGRDPFTRLLVDVTEPLLAPVRALLSRVLPIPIDFSPLVVILLIWLLQSMLSRAYYGAF